MSVFFTDTDCEMHWTDAEKLGIHVIGMPYTIKNQEYVYDYGKNTNIKEFYDMMRSGEVSITSALNSEDYINYFEPIFEKGEDIFYVHFSSELSGTFNHMQVALETLKEKYPDRKVTCFDKKNISLFDDFYNNIENIQKGFDIVNKYFFDVHYSNKKSEINEIQKEKIIQDYLLEN